MDDTVIKDVAPKPRVIPGLITDSSTISGATPLQVVQGEKDIREAGLNQQATSGSAVVDAVRSVGDSFASGGNTAVQLMYDLRRMENSGPVDPNWRDAGGSDEWLKANSSLVPANQAWRYKQTKNATEAQMMLNDAMYNARIQEKIARRFQINPTSTFVASSLAGLVDVDAPLTFFSGGLSAGAKIGLNATKFGRVLAGGVSGAAVGLGVQTLGVSSNPIDDWTSIPAAGLGGAAFGILAGALARRPAGLGPSTEQLANEARVKTLDEFGEATADGNVRSHEDIRKEPQTHSDPYGSQAAQDALAEAEAAKPTPAARSPQAIKLDDDKLHAEEVQGETMPEDAPLEGRATVGARQMQSTGPGTASIKSTRTQDIIQNARTRDQQLGVSGDWFANSSNIPGPLGRAAQKFQDGLNASPFATDFARFMRSGSVTAQMLAYDLMESANGIIRNNRSAAMLMDHYHKDMLGNFMPYHDAFDEWASSVKQASVWQKIVDTKIRDEFNTQLIGELNERNYGSLGQPRSVPHPTVTKAADAIDATFAREIEINQGRPGEGTTKGYETMQAKSGYFPQKWLGGKMQKLINSGVYGQGAAGRKAIVQAITESYQSMHPAMAAKDAQIWAEAVVDRALTMNEGISLNLVGIMKDNDGRKAIELMMARNGASKQEIDRLIDTLTGTKEEAGRAGHTKNRVDADLRFTASNGIRLMDLVDTDVNKLVAMRARKAAGSAAMARKGIYSKADMDEIREAILQEQNANGPSQTTGSAADFLDKDRHLESRDIEDMFSYFNGTPIAGGISPMLSRIRKLTNLGLLNQLGLTQLAEFGPMIAAVGWKRFGDMSGKELMDTLKKVDSPLVQELKHMNVFVPEEKMFRDDLTFDYEKTTGATSEYMHKFDNFLNKAQRLQGYTSAFYQVRKLQQRIAMTTGVNKFVQMIKSGTGSADRLRDAGFDAGLIQRVQDNVQHMQFDANGDLVKLNLDKWDTHRIGPFPTTANTAEDFVLALNRTTNQLVQKAMAGESSAMFHRDGVAALFWHLKSFPMLAIEKQTLRNARITDSQAMATFMYGLATAGAAYTVKQAINGTTENLTPGRVAREAFGLSNMTGWIPMWIDPLAGMLGMDSYKLSSYGSHGATAVFSVPAALTTMDRLSQVPGSLGKMLNPFVEASNSDVRNLQVLPLIGNAYGFTAIFNAMKDGGPKHKTTPKPVAKPVQQAPVHKAVERSKDKAQAMIDHVLNN